MASSLLDELHSESLIPSFPQKRDTVSTNSDVPGTVLDILQGHCHPNPGWRPLFHFADEQTEYRREPAHGLEVAEPDLRVPQTRRAICSRRNPSPCPQDFTSEIQLAKQTLAWLSPASLIPGPNELLFLSLFMMPMYWRPGHQYHCKPTPRWSN